MGGALVIGLASLFGTITELLPEYRVLQRGIPTQRLLQDLRRDGGDGGGGGGERGKIKEEGESESLPSLSSLMGVGKGAGLLPTRVGLLSQERQQHDDEHNSQQQEEQEEEWEIREYDPSIAADVLRTTTTTLSSDDETAFKALLRYYRFAKSEHLNRNRNKDRRVGGESSRGGGEEEEDGDGRRRKLITSTSACEIPLRTHPPRSRRGSEAIVALSSPVPLFPPSDNAVHHHHHHRHHSTSSASSEEQQQQQLSTVVGGRTLERHQQVQQPQSPFLTAFERVFGIDLKEIKGGENPRKDNQNHDDEHDDDDDDDKTTITSTTTTTSRVEEHPPQPPPSSGGSFRLYLPPHLYPSSAAAPTPFSSSVLTGLGGGGSVVGGGHHHRVTLRDVPRRTSLVLQLSTHDSEQRIQEIVSDIYRNNKNNEYKHDTRNNGKNHNNEPSNHRLAAATTTSTSQQSVSAAASRTEQQQQQIPPPPKKMASYAGETIVFTGKLELGTRTAAEKMAQTAGAQTSSHLSGKTTLLVVGRDAGSTKLAKAKSAGGVRVITEAAFRAGLLLESPPPTYAVEGVVGPDEGDPLDDRRSPLLPDSSDASPAGVLLSSSSLMAGGTGTTTPSPTPTPTYVLGSHEDVEVVDYHPSWTPWFLRRRELHIPLEAYHGPRDEVLSRVKVQMGTSFDPPNPIHYYDDENIDDGDDYSTSAAFSASSTDSDDDRNDDGDKKNALLLPQGPLALAAAGDNNNNFVVAGTNGNGNGAVDDDDDDDYDADDTDDEGMLMTKALKTQRSRTRPRRRTNATKTEATKKRRAAEAKEKRKNSSSTSSTTKKKQSTKSTKTKKKKKKTTTNSSSSKNEEVKKKSGEAVKTKKKKTKTKDTKGDIDTGDGEEDDDYDYKVKGPPNVTVESFDRLIRKDKNDRERYMDFKVELRAVPVPGYKRKTENMWCIVKYSGQVGGKESVSVTQVPLGYSSAMKRAQTMWTNEEMKAKKVLAMLANKWEDRQKYISEPFYVQPKLDGVRLLVSNQGGISRTGKIIPGTEVLGEGLADGQYLDGECYDPTLEFEDIASLFATDPLKLMFYVFDYFDLAKPHMSFEERLQHIRTMTMMQKQNEKNQLHHHSSLVETTLLQQRSDIQDTHAHFVQQGYEGTMIRDRHSRYEVGRRSNYLLKHKDFHTEEYEIVGAKTGRGREAKAIVWVLQMKDGQRFTARPEGSLEAREKLFKQYKTYLGKMLTVRLQSVTAFNVPRFPVAVAIRDYE